MSQYGVPLGERASPSGSPNPGALPPIPKRIVGATAVLAVAMVVFIGALVVQNLPPTPARQVLLPLAKHVIDPWFSQTWTLFAPTPPIVNEEILLEARYRPAAHLADPPAVNVSALFQTIAEQRRWAPSRLYRVTMGLAVEVNRVANGTFYGRGARPATGGSALASQESEAQDYFAPSSLGTVAPLTPVQADQYGEFITVQLQRLLSATAHGVVAHARQLASIRAVVTSTPIAPYTQRNRRQRTTTIFETGWMPYLSSVPA